MKHGFVEEQSGGPTDGSDKVAKTYGIFESASCYSYSFFLLKKGAENPFDFPNLLLRRVDNPFPPLMSNFRFMPETETDHDNNNNKSMK